MQSTLSESKQVGLFPCRGPVVPCRTLSLVSATCDGTVKPGFEAEVRGTMSKASECAEYNARINRTHRNHIRPLRKCRIAVVVGAGL